MPQKTKIVVAILAAPDSIIAQPFRQMIAADAELSGRIQLKCAASAQFAEVIEEAEVVVCSSLPAELLNEAQKLKWVSFWHAGLEKKLTPELLRGNILITNASGVHGPNIAEHVLAMMLMFTRRMPFYFKAQLEGRWAHSDDELPTGGNIGELTGKTLGIIGLGRIGEALAERAKSFGMKIIAVKRDPQSRHDSGVPIDALYSLAELPVVLEQSDHIAICLPLTAETEHLFNREMLALISPKAFLYNISRGSIIKQTALVEALEAKKIKGAGLDVFEDEPLAADSSLWHLDNVILTPHVAGFTPHYFERAAKLFVADLKRYVSGQPLENLYVRERGY